MSVYYNLLVGVQNSLQAVPLIPPVVIRDDIFVLDGDKMPLVIVSPSRSHEKIRLQTFDSNVIYEYEVIVAYLVKGNRIVSADLSNFMDIREAIRNQLYQIDVPGLQNAWDTNMEIGSVNQFDALATTNYRVTGWAMKYSVSETRLGA